MSKIKDNFKCKILPLIIFAMSFSSCETYNYFTEDKDTGEKQKVDVSVQINSRTLYTVRDTNNVILWRNVYDSWTNRVYGVPNNTVLLHERKQKVQ